jgi:hypothetical protein
MSVVRMTTAKRSTCLLLAFALVAATGPVSGSADPGPQSAPASEQPPPKIPADQLDSLVAPIALYQDSLLAQVLAASTYPLELIQLQQWLVKNPKLKDKALADAVAKQPWDPSVQGMAALPDVVKRLADDIQWTTDLGNAFLAQQGDVMDAVQRMRKKAQEKGNLKSSEQMKVETKVVESKSVIVVEQSNPQVVYVPSYDPVVVYGPPVYAYPPIYYPPPPPSGWAVAGGMALSFGVGMAMGAMWSGGWGYHCGWGGGNNNITINRNNNFNRNTNISGGNRTNVSGGNRTNVSGGNSSWQHNPEHRGGAPYSDRSTANKYGGSARGDSGAKRQTDGRQQGNRQGGNPSSSRGGANVSDRAGVSDRSAGGGANRGGSAGGDRVGDRSVSGGGGGDKSAFGGGGGGFSGSSARSSSSRGASSSGGGSRGGGSRGGGGRRR